MGDWITDKLVEECRRPLARVAACTTGPHAATPARPAVPVSDGQAAMFGQIMPMSGELELEQITLEETSR